MALSSDRVNSIKNITSAQKNPSLLLNGYSGNKSTSIQAVCALKGMIVRYPWRVIKSNNYEGRYYFHNTETNKSVWSLKKIDASTIILDQKQINIYNVLDMKEKEDNTLLNLTQNNKLSGDVSSPSSSYYSSSISGSNSEQTACSSISDRSSNSEPDIDRSIDDNDEEDTAAAAEDDSDIDYRKMRSGHENTSNNHLHQSLNSINMTTSNNNYSVLDGLGSGGFALVLKVKEMNTNQIYAMKMINKSKQSKIQIKNEINALLLLHSNEQSKSSSITEDEKEKLPFSFIQKCYHVFENSNHIFYIIDYYSGSDLFYHLNKKLKYFKQPFNENEVQFIIAEISLGLEHIHNHGMIHRDIKIENIMLDSKGHVKIVDFGGVINLNDKNNIPTIENLKRNGSLIYMSPELIKNSVFGTFTDFWALGVLLYELLTGNSPWSSLTNNKIIKNDICNHSQIKIILSLNKYISQHSNILLLGLLNHDYKKRIGIKDIKSNQILFFESIDFHQLVHGLVQPRYIPGEIILPRRSSALIYMDYLEQMKLSHHHHIHLTKYHHLTDHNLTHHNNNVHLHEQHHQQNHQGYDKTDHNWSLGLESADQFLSLDL